MVELKKTVSTHRGAAVLISYDEIEKFAELIVRECMWITVKQTHIPSNYRKDVNTMIKQHFGVEE